MTRTRKSAAHSRSSAVRQPKAVPEASDGRRISDSSSLTELLLTEAKVAVVPGSAFGGDGYLRLSYATSMENIIKGLDNIEKLMNKIK